MLGELRVIADERAGDPDSIVDRLRTWTEQGRPEPGPAQWGVDWIGLIAKSVGDRHTNLVAAAALSNDPTVVNSLAAIHPVDGYTPAQRAVQLDCASFLTALAATRCPEVLNSLEAPHPREGFTPLLRAAYLGRGAAFKALILAGVDQKALGQMRESERVQCWLKEVEAVRSKEGAHGHPGALSSTSTNAGNSTQYPDILARAGAVRSSPPGGRGPVL